MDMDAKYRSDFLSSSFAHRLKRSVLDASSLVFFHCDVLDDFGSGGLRRRYDLLQVFHLQSP